MIYFGNHVTMRGPVLAAFIKKFSTARKICKVIHPTRKSSKLVDVGGVTVFPLHVVNVPKCDHALWAGVVENVTSPTVGRTWNGANDGFHQRKAHHFCIELVGGGQVFGGKCDMMKSHVVSLPRLT